MCALILTDTQRFEDASSPEDIPVGGDVADLIPFYF